MKNIYLAAVTFLSVALLISSASYSADTTNMVANPSFELDTNRDDRPDHWHGPILPDGKTGAVFLDRALPMNGNVQLTTVFMEEGEHALTQPVKLKPATKYTLGCWIRGRGARGNAWIRFRQTKPSTQRWESKRVPQGHSDWTLYQTTFVTPDDHQAGQIEICWQLSLQGLFRFDFVSLVEGDQPPVPPNTPPRVRSDSFDVQRGALFGIAEPGILKNDEDADHDELKVSDFSQPEHGHIAVATNGALTYRPNADFQGKDSFEYRVSDGKGGESPARVNLNVADIPQPENLIANSSFEQSVDTTNKPTAWDSGEVYRFSLDTAESRSGKYSLRIDSRNSPQFSRQAGVKFKKGKRYRLSAWIKGKALSKDSLTIRYVSPNGQRRWGTPAASGTFDWRKVSVEFGSKRDPVDGGSVDVLASFQTGQAWIDDVTVEEFESPFRVFIDGYSVTGGVVPILKELGRDALSKGVIDREISITRSPPPDRNVITNAMPYDAALMCNWAGTPKDKYFAGEVPRLTEWKSWFAKNDPSTKVMIFHWQPWGLYHWPDGFTELAADYQHVARKVGIPIVPTTLAFKKIAEQADDPLAALRKLYFADYHHAGRVGNYVKACCAFAAVTGKSPVGLTHILPIDIDFGWPPETLTRKEATAFQTVCWLAWQEANDLTSTQ